MEGFKEQMSINREQEKRKKNEEKKVNILEYFSKMTLGQIRHSFTLHVKNIKICYF